MASYDDPPEAVRENLDTYPDDVHPIRIPKGHKVEIQEEQGRGLIRGTRVSMEELDRRRARQREEGGREPHETLKFEHDGGGNWTIVWRGPRGQVQQLEGSDARSLASSVLGSDEWAHGSWRPSTDTEGGSPDPPPPPTDEDPNTFI